MSALISDPKVHARDIENPSSWTCLQIIGASVFALGVLATLGAMDRNDLRQTKANTLLLITHGKPLTAGMITAVEKTCHDFGGTCLTPGHDAKTGIIVSLTADRLAQNLSTLVDQECAALGKVGTCTTKLRDLATVLQDKSVRQGAKLQTASVE